MWGSIWGRNINTTCWESIRTCLARGGKLGLTHTCRGISARSIKGRWLASGIVGLEFSTGVDKNAKTERQEPGSQRTQRGTGKRLAGDGLRQRMQASVDCRL